MLTRSVPVSKAYDDALIAYGQNGEAIRPEQGYPARLFLPGWEGNASVKWLRRIEVSDHPFMTREETSKYTDLRPNGKAVQFSFDMEAKSVITFPSGEMQLDGPGFYEISGLAWSGHGAVKRVDISVDGGKTWKPAALQGPVLPICHTRFRFPWHWDGKEAILQSRCVDDDLDAVEGAAQPGFVSDIPDEIAHHVLGKLLLHFELLQLVAAEHDEAAGLEGL